MVHKTDQQNRAAAGPVGEGRPKPMQTDTLLSNLCPQALDPESLVLSFEFASAAPFSKSEFLVVGWTQKNVLANKDS